MASMKRKEEIIKIVTDAGQPVASSYVARLLGENVPSVSRKLATLTQQGILQRSYGEGNSYLYNLGVNKVSARRRAKQGKRAVTTLTPDQLLGFLRKWSTEQWQPKIFNSSVQLPKTLAQLYQYAVDIAYGSPVDRSMLLESMANLNDFRRDLLQTLKIVEAVMETSQLKDPKEIALYLLRGMEPDEFSRLSGLVLEINS